MSEQQDLKRKRTEAAEKRFKKIKEDVAEMNAPPKMAVWRARLIETLHENGFEMESLEEDDDKAESIFEIAADTSTPYKPRIDVEKAMQSKNPLKEIEPAALKAIEIMIKFLEKSGEGQYELIDDPENKKQLKRLSKAAATLPETALKATRPSHLQIVYDVMTYAENEIVDGAGLAIEMFELVLEEAQLAGALPK